MFYHEKQENKISKFNLKNNLVSNPSRMSRIISQISKANLHEDIA